MKKSVNSNTTSAVVIGLCVHGLAVCRALAKCNIQVHALEKNNDMSLHPANLLHWLEVSIVRESGNDVKGQWSDDLPGRMDYRVVFSLSPMLAPGHVQVSIKQNVFS